MVDPLNAPFAGRQLHFIGIGGAGMSGLALVAKELGATVTGSDQAVSSYCERLREAGIEPRLGSATVMPFDPRTRSTTSRRFSFTKPQLGAAGLALMVMSGSGVWVLQRTTSLTPLTAAAATRVP